MLLAFAIPGCVTFCQQSNNNNHKCFTLAVKQQCADGGNASATFVAESCMLSIVLSQCYLAGICDTRPECVIFCQQSYNVTLLLCYTSCMY